MAPDLTQSHWGHRAELERLVFSLGMVRLHALPYVSEAGTWFAPG